MEVRQFEICCAEKCSENGRVKLGVCKLCKNSLEC